MKNKTPFGYKEMDWYKYIGGLQICEVCEYSHKCLRFNPKCKTNPVYYKKKKWFKLIEGILFK